jgi:hypothetical protein
MRFSTFWLPCALVAITALQGCTVIAIADTVGSMAVRTAGAAASVAADAAIGTVKITGKVVGAVADTVIPGGGEKN